MTSQQPTSNVTSSTYYNPAPFTPMVFVSACTELAAAGPILLLRVTLAQMVHQLDSQGIKPRDFVGHMWSPKWAKCRWLWSIIGPDFDYSIVFGCSTINEISKELDTSGPLLVIAACSVHLAPFDKNSPAMKIVSQVLQKLGISRLNAAEYLQDWLTDNRYIVNRPDLSNWSVIPQHIIDTPEIFQVILSSTDIATPAIVTVIRESYEVSRTLSRSTANGLVTSFANLELSEIPKDETRCPHCWRDWDEASPAEVNHAVKLTPCGHLFGHDRLVESLIGSNSARCPMCRQNMVAVALATQAG